MRFAWAPKSHISSILCILKHSTLLWYWKRFTNPLIWHLQYQIISREFKQITTAGATTAAMTEKVWGEYVSVVCQILSLASKAKYKDERNID